MTTMLPPGVQDRVDRARHLEAEGRQTLSDSAELMRSVARELSEAGWTGKTIAAALAVSRQRVSQLLAYRRIDDGGDGRHGAGGDPL